MDAALLGLDPLFLTNVKITIHDLLKLEQTDEGLIGVYKLFSHKIKLAEICGIVVAVERNSYTTNYTVDDGTGAITCSYWSTSERFDYKPFEIGTAVRITGKISTFRDERQIVIYDIYPTLDPNQELQHFIQAMLLKKEYEKEYELPEILKPNVQELVEQIQINDEDQLVYNSQTLKVDVSAFEDQVLQFLKGYSMPMFSKDAPRDNPELVQMAELVLTKQFDDPPKKSEITHLFTKALEKWLKEGYIVECGRDGTYKVVDEEYLSKLILSSIKEMSKQYADKYSGIRIEYIIKSIGTDREYAGLVKNNKIIYKIVDHLVEQSLIYPTGHLEYKVFM
ncbi:hypothetical protein [Parasitella parasitica]|uniref:CST complex subunit STN1 n=1 Tax=Parasitella parasitica TaxID=35722 RepID=A0A0B7N5D5_9FUNG|nr:hypothetical protein [Parasitella parasitica]